MTQQPQRGFTLIEVMVTVAILAIITSIALPSYTAYVQRGRVPAALDALNSYYTRMEQRYQDGNPSTYANGADCGVALPTAPNFTLSCTISAGGQAFTAKATGSGNMSGYTYSIDHLGVRRTEAHPKGTPAGNCWSTRGKSCDT
jgi:type IV pilus assembly protein PilE